MSLHAPSICNKVTNDTFPSVVEDQIIWQSVFEISVATVDKGPLILLPPLWQMLLWHRMSYATVILSGIISLCILHFSNHHKTHNPHWGRLNQSKSTSYVAFLSIQMLRSPIGENCHTGYGIFNCGSMKYNFLLQWNMPYPIWKCQTYGTAQISVLEVCVRAKTTPSFTFQ